MLVDIHSHLTFPEFKDDLDNVIKRAKAAGLVCIVTSGTSISSNAQVIELSKKYDIVKASLGAYPTEVTIKNIDSQIEFIEKNKKDAFAIGECGLDLKEAKNTDEQKYCFQKIIGLAEKLKRPLIIHSRNAELESLEILKSSKAKKIIMHCFMARKNIIKRAYDEGYFFSIPTVVTRLQHFQEMVKDLPIDRILTETDAPYLSPFKFERNEPAFVVETIKKIAEIKNLDQEEVKKMIFMNFKRVFL